MTKPDWQKLELMVLNGASGAAILTMWKAHEAKARARGADVVDSIEFAQFWAAYPKRDGANPKQEAANAFSRAMKRGIEPSQIIAAAVALAQEWEGKPRDQRRFIPMASTWINQHRFRDASDIAAGAARPADINWDQVLEGYKRFKTWQTKYYGPGPDSPACRAPRALLEKHGLVA